MPDGQLGSGILVLIFLVLLVLLVVGTAFAGGVGQLITRLRREFQVAGARFGELAEGDRGRLSHQGSRLVSFQRDRTIEAR
jgi:hypothetical protein